MLRRAAAATTQQVLLLACLTGTAQATEPAPTPDRERPARYPARALGSDLDPYLCTYDVVLDDKGRAPVEGLAPTEATPCPPEVDVAARKALKAWRWKNAGGRALRVHVPVVPPMPAPPEPSLWRRRWGGACAAEATVHHGEVVLTNGRPLGTGNRSDQPAELCSSHDGRHAVSGDQAAHGARDTALGAGPTSYCAITWLQHPDRGATAVETFHCRPAHRAAARAVVQQAASDTPLPQAVPWSWVITFDPRGDRSAQ